MSLDPKKLDEAVKRVISVAHYSETTQYRQQCYEKEYHYWADVAKASLEAYGVSDLEARAARADQLQKERDADQITIRNFSDALRDRDAEIAALKAELARFEWRPIEQAKYYESCRVLVSGWQERQGNVAAYRWTMEDNIYEGLPHDHKDADLFMPLPTPPQAKEAGRDNQHV